MMKVHYKETELGFEYGSADATRCISDDKRGWAVVQVDSRNRAKENKLVHACQIYVTKTGKMQVHVDGEKVWP